MSEGAPTGPLDGYRVIELGTLIAGPFAGKLLGDMGADVIKIESPDRPDPLRTWGQAEQDGHRFFWTVHARNKRCVTLDLRVDAGRDLFLNLIEHADVVVENFRPGTLEKWGLGFDVLSAAQSEVGVGQGIRLRAERTASQERRLRLGCRSGQRISASERLSRAGASAYCPFARRFSRRDVRRSGSAGSVALTRAEPAVVRWSTLPSRNPVWRCRNPRSRITIGAGSSGSPRERDWRVLRRPTSIRPLKETGW